MGDSEKIKAILALEKLVIDKGHFDGISSGMQEYTDNFGVDILIKNFVRGYVGLSLYKKSTLPNPNL